MARQPGKKNSHRFQAPARLLPMPPKREKCHRYICPRNKDFRKRTPKKPDSILSSIATYWTGSVGIRSPFKLFDGIWASMWKFSISPGFARWMSKKNTTQKDFHKNPSCLIKRHLSFGRQWRCSGFLHSLFSSVQRLYAGRNVQVLFSQTWRHIPPPDINGRHFRHNDTAPLFLPIPYGSGP